MLLVYKEMMLLRSKDFSLCDLELILIVNINESVLLCLRKYISNPKSIYNLPFYGAIDAKIQSANFSTNAF